MRAAISEHYNMFSRYSPGGFIWINMESEATREACLCEIITMNPFLFETATVEGRNDQTSYSNRVIDYLSDSKHGRWLAVFDNVNSLSTAEAIHLRFLPQSANGHVIITTRLQTLPDEMMAVRVCTLVPLPDFGVDDSALLLLRTTMLTVG